MKIASKKLFVFLDGTWQDGVNNNSPLTNVATLARCLQSQASDGSLQMVYYSSGVGNGTSRPVQAIDAMTGRGTAHVFFRSSGRLTANSLSVVELLTHRVNV